MSLPSPTLPKSQIRYSTALTLILALGSRGIPGTLNAALVISLIGKMLLKVFLDRPVAHVALEECVLLPGL